MFQRIFLIYTAKGEREEQTGFNISSKDFNIKSADDAQLMTENPVLMAVSEEILQTPKRRNQWKVRKKGELAKMRRQQEWQPRI